MIFVTTRLLAYWNFKNRQNFRYVPPLDKKYSRPMDISIGFDNFEILKIDDRDFTVEINAYLIVKWKDSRVIINKVSELINLRMFIKFVLHCRSCFPAFIALFV